jgi:hypothetical protein
LAEKSDDRLVEISLEYIDFSLPKQLTVLKKVVWSKFLQNTPIFPQKISFDVCGGPLMCGGPCSAEHVEHALIRPWLYETKMKPALIFKTELANLEAAVAL